MSFSCLIDVIDRRIIEIKQLEPIYHPIALGRSYRWFLWFLSGFYTSWTLARSGGKWVVVARFRWFFDLWKPWDLYYSYLTQNLPIYVFYGSNYSWFGLRYAPECHFHHCRSRLVNKIVQFRWTVNILRQNEFYRPQRYHNVKNHSIWPNQVHIQIDNTAVVMYVGVFDL